MLLYVIDEYLILQKVISTFVVRFINKYLYFWCIILGVSCKRENMKVGIGLHVTVDSGMAEMGYLAFMLNKKVEFPFREIG